MLRLNADGVRQVLLGRKKTGLGRGNIVGLGGKIESGETPLQAIVREVEEESSLVLEPGALREVGYLRYVFPHRQSWSQNSTVFVAERYSGEPVETDEIAPEWYDIMNPPLDLMWDDARFWLPRVLAGERVSARFSFEEDLKTVAWSEFDDELSTR